MINPIRQTWDWFVDFWLFVVVSSLWSKVTVWRRFCKIVLTPMNHLHWWLNDRVPYEWSGGYRSDWAEKQTRSYK